MGVIVDEPAVEDGANFIDAIRKQEAAIEHGDPRICAVDIGAIDIDDFVQIPALANRVSTGRAAMRDNRTKMGGLLDRILLRLFEPLDLSRLS